MPRLTALTCCVGLLLTVAPPALANDDCQPDQKGGWKCEPHREEAGTPGTDAPPPPPVPALPTDTVWIEIPVLVETPDGFCRATRSVLIEPPPEPSVFENAAKLDYAGEVMVVRDRPGVLPIPPCPPASAGTDGQAFRRPVSDLLPRPSPNIAPGWGITGLRAFLESGTDMAYSSGLRRVDLGGVLVDIVVEATSVLDVDWGDGTIDTDIDDPGGPWPHGLVSHVYENTGTYDVTITQRWNVSWTMAGDRGIFPTETTTTYPFLVREVIPVIVG